MNLDEILENYNELEPVNFYRFFLESRVLDLCTMTSSDFEEIYLALFDDDIEELEEYSEQLYNPEILEDFEDRIDILYDELIFNSTKNFPFRRFEIEYNESNYNQIITDYISFKTDYSKKELVFEYYKLKRKDEQNYKKLRKK